MWQGEDRLHQISAYHTVNVRENPAAISRLVCKWEDHREVQRRVWRLDQVFVKKKLKFSLFYPLVLLVRLMRTQCCAVFPPSFVLEGSVFCITPHFSIQILRIPHLLQREGGFSGNSFYSEFFHYQFLHARHLGGTDHFKCRCGDMGEINHTCTCVQ